jgi:hypothetical protein
MLDCFFVLSELFLHKGEILMRKSTNGGQPMGLWLVLLLATVTFLSNGHSVQAQSPAISQTEVNGVTMSVYPVERGADGQQYITTPKGFKVTVPGLGIAPDANEVAVYRNDKNEFWYVDRNGVTQPVTHDQLQWTVAQIQHQQATRNIQIEKTAEPYGVPPGVVPGAAMGAGIPLGAVPPAAVPGMVPTGMVPYGMVPATQPASTVIVNQQPATQGAGVGTTAAISGLAAAGGAMAGSAIAGSMYNHGSTYGVPYGVPMYHAAGHTYYNGVDGAHYEVPANAANHYNDEWNRQEAYQNNSQNRQNAYHNLNENQQQMLKNQGKLRMDEPGGFGRGRFRR